MAAPKITEQKIASIICHIPKTVFLFLVWQHVDLV